MKRTVLALLAVGLVAAGCAKSSEQTTVATPGNASFKLGTVPSTLEGNVLTIPVTVSGIQIVKPNGDTSGKTGHFHIFIDKQPPVVGDAIAKAPGIVHWPSIPIKLYGLKIGTHSFHVVLGDGIHRRLPGEQQVVSVDVKGPSVWAEAPAAVAKGAPVTVQLHSAGFDVVPVSGSAMSHESPAASGMKEGHYHLLVDPASPPTAGQTLPEPRANKVIHTGESSVTINDLAPGDHVIFVVAGSTSHVAFEPAVMARVAVTVTP